MGGVQEGGEPNLTPTPTINGITKYKQIRPCQNSVFFLNTGGENVSKSPTLTSSSQREPGADDYMGRC